MLQDFKYWLAEASLHEPLKLPKESEENGGAKHPATNLHRTFKEVRFSNFPCDRCRNPARSIEYQCTDCDQRYCTSCWPLAHKRGAHLVDTDGQSFDPEYQSVELGTLEPTHSANSSVNLVSGQAPTGYLPLQHIEEGRFSFSPDILSGFS